MAMDLAGIRAVAVAAVVVVAVRFWQAMRAGGKGQLQRFRMPTERRRSFHLPLIHFIKG